MSQYPNSPYSTPQPFSLGYSPDPHAAYLAPARRAGVLMLVVGGLICAYGLCNGLTILFAPAERLLEQNRIFSGAEPQVSAEVFRGLGVFFSLTALLIGLAHVGIALPVRKGHRGAITFGIILTCILGAIAGLFLLLALLVSLIQPMMLIIAFGMLIPVAVLIWQFIWLLSARKAGTHLINARLHYQQQYAQYQQYQQMYGYGYAQSQQPGDTNGSSSAR